MLSSEDFSVLNNFLNRLQGKSVRTEIGSRINLGFRMSFATTLDKQGDSFSLTSDSGDVTIFFNPNEAEGFSSDHSSVSLLYGDNLVTVRYARKR
jgi:hypothetical protein